MASGRRLGFTLIELLIVIAIIGILAAVLIPNLLGARARSADASAQAYLNEVATFQEIYAIDTFDYADDWASLDSLGLNPPPTAVARGADAADAVLGYCFAVEADRGQVRTWQITATGGVAEGNCGGG